MKVKTFSDRAHHFQTVNDRFERFIQDNDIVVSEIKPFVTDSKYMLVVLYKDAPKKKAPVKKS